MITENLSVFKIHKLTQEQYDAELAAGTLDSNALYLTPDSDDGVSVDEVTIGINSDGNLYVKDGSIDVAKIENVQALRNEMGLGNTLSALPVANGGTGATTASAALANLGITMGTTVAPDTGTPNSIYIQLL